MTSELKERFALADEVGSPELWSEARRRAAGPERQLARFDRVGFGPGGRRIMTAAVAFAVFAAAAVFAWELSHPDVAPEPPPVADEPVDLAVELGPGWTELPGPPRLLGGAASAWTGSELLRWGGEEGDDVLADDGFGYSFDAASRTWGRIPDGPLAPRSHAAFAWTGHELVIWGGRSDECCEPSAAFLGDGAAYDPASRTWRRIAPAPIESRSPFSVWTGDELLVWGNQDRDVRYLDGAAYDPVTDTWRRIAEGPIEITDGTAVWTGDEMIVLGAALHGGNVPESETAIGALYDPETDTWRELPPSIDTNPNANRAVWADGRLIAIDYDSDAEAFDPVTGRWRRLERMPLDDGEDRPRVAYADGWTFVNFFGQVAAFSSETERWTDLTDEVPGKDVPSGTPLAAGGAFLLPTRSSDLSEEPNLEFDTTMLAWVPPSTVEEVSPFVPHSETVGDATKMHVVFPDGSRVTLVYPTHLQLAALGVQPDLSYSFGGRYQGPIVFIHDPDASIRPYLESGEGSMLINSSEGGLEVFPADGETPAYWIDLELPAWTVLIPIEDPGGGAAKVAGFAVQVAAALDVRETGDGFPVVEASGEAELAEGFGEAGGPQLSFGDHAPEPDVVSQLDATILLSPDGCDPSATGAFSDGYGSSCLGDDEVFASIYGDREFVTAVQEGLIAELPSAPAEEIPFTPEYTVTGGEARMPVVFPDGTEATVVYPTQIDLASLGVQPEVSYLWKDDPPPRFPILFLHDRDPSIAEYVDGTEPVGTVNSYRSIEIWRMSEAWSKRRVLLQGHWLRYELPSWTVLVAIERSDQAEDVAASIAIHETGAGFPVVTTSGPIALSHESGEGEGPMLSIGSVGDRAVVLWIERCSGGARVDEILESGAYGSACLADGQVTATIYGNPSAVEAIVEGLRMEGFRPAA